MALFVAFIIGLIIFIVVCLGMFGMALVAISKDISDEDEILMNKYIEENKIKEK